MMSKSRQHEFSQALYDIIYHALLGQGVDKTQATTIAEESTDTVLDEFGGRICTFQKTSQAKPPAVTAKSMMSSQATTTKYLPKSMV
ncbi:hypothetical protein [Moraxella nonliquefaciens]|uniref:hypothetical protein n=1 Tax=Moraxella nonliquefaciens TaxID=478 RepID=UPI003EE142C3